MYAAAIGLFGEARSLWAMLPVGCRSSVAVTRFG